MSWFRNWLLLSLTMLLMVTLFGCASTVTKSGAEAEEFLRAALGGDLGAVNRLLASGVDVNSKDRNGATALILAAQKGHSEVVVVLLSAKADVNVKTTDYGNTALILASLNGHQDVIQKLLEAKANVNAKDNDGSSSLFLASQEGHLDVVDSLLAANADVNAPAKNGSTALMQASAFGHRNVAKALIAAGANVNTQRADGGSARSLASQQGHQEIVRLLNEATEKKATKAMSNTPKSRRQGGKCFFTMVTLSGSSVVNYPCP